MASEAIRPIGPLSYLRDRPDADGLPVFQRLQSNFGFVPNLFRVQTSRPELIDAELSLLEGVIGQPSALTRQQKEYIFLVCSAANLSTYCVTSHCEIVRMLGIDGPEPEQVALDYTSASLPLPMKALLNFAAKLNRQAQTIGEADIEALRTFGYSEDQIMEAVLIVGVARFTNTVSLGLGVLPDFDNPAVETTIGKR